MEHSFSRRSSVGKEVGWDDIFRNVLSKRADSDDELQEALGPSVAPTAPRHLISSGVSYVKLQPSKDLAILASTSDETIQAVKTLANALGHRWRFIGRYRTPRFSPAVRLVDRSVPPCNLESRVTTQDVDTDVCSWLDGSQKVYEGLSKEPLFDPFSVTPPNACSAKFEFIDGVMHVFWDPEREDAEPPLLWSPNLIPSVREYLAALQDVMIAVQDPACKTFCYRRIKFLEGKFNFHLMFNSNEEMEETKHNKHRDFYNVRKVDTHVHHSACMHQKHLLRFIRKKYRTEGDTVVAMEGGQGITLKGLFQKELGFSASEASVDHLNVHALGRFLAELTKEVIEDLDDRK
ncbi:adenosine monophosphate deaminase, putative [Eimeria maxima]|uniref:Adenosine monophosphate deaminase, putative n=1 Tax=Eimeria maxima TaxID=5804 RepID=U6M9N3_EIMMA|nr:adenosine monophosphate deaminase, putative [Eimeria maxima]CDJ59189.1 adenosine monophosphate deaminase, putative [Eimeria maxima]